MMFLHRRLNEMGEPNWTSASEEKKSIILPQLKELHFDLDEKIRLEIERVCLDCEKRVRKTTKSKNNNNKIQMKETNEII